MDTMGKQYKKKIASIQDFVKHINAFIELSQEKGFAPTDHALWSYLGVKPSEYDHLSKGRNPDGGVWEHRCKTDEEQKMWEERDKREADDAVKKLVAYREDRLVKELEKSRTTSSNVIFQLKQPKNGGYQDVQQTESNASVTIKVDGIGGLEAFK